VNNVGKISSYSAPTMHAFDFILVLFSVVYAGVGKAVTSDPPRRAGSVTSDERIWYFAALQAPLSG
jgi:hypothetical protein